MSIAHLRLRKETGASRVLLGTVLATTIALVLFSIYTIQNDPKFLSCWL